MIKKSSSVSFTLATIAILGQPPSIRAFTLYVSLTPDNLLERVMTIADLSLLRQGERGIFQMLGSCMSVSSGFAMLEEDVLEYLHQLQSNAACRPTKRAPDWRDSE